MTDREELIEDRREALQEAYVLTSVEQAELSAVCCARFCQGFLQAMEGQALMTDDLVRLMQAALQGGAWR